MRVYEGLPHFEGLPEILIMDLMINYDKLWFIIIFPRTWRVNTKYWSIFRQTHTHIYTLSKFSKIWDSSWNIVFRCKQPPWIHCVSIAVQGIDAARVSKMAGGYGPWRRGPSLIVDIWFEGFLKWGYSQVIHVLFSDVPSKINWNNPSSYWGNPIEMGPSMSLDII